MSSRACPDWPDLLEIAPDLQFMHYTLREAQLPPDAFVKLEGVDMDSVSICCDLESHVYNPTHTEPIVMMALEGTHWMNVHESVQHRPAPTDTAA